jgi:hypothetical protein
MGIKILRFESAGTGRCDGRDKHLMAIAIGNSRCRLHGSASPIGDCPDIASKYCLVLFDINDATLARGSEGRQLVSVVECVVRESVHRMKNRKAQLEVQYRLLKVDQSTLLVFAFGIRGVKTGRQDAGLVELDHEYGYPLLFPETLRSISGSQSRPGEQRAAADRL